MRRRLAALLLLLFASLGASEAEATGGLTFINLVWTGTTGTGALGSSTIDVSSVEPETLSLDVVLDVGAYGLYFLQTSILFDFDLENELDLVSARTFAWDDPNSPTRFNTLGFVTSQESEGDAEGQVFALGGFATGGRVPPVTTLTFARMVFVTSPSRVTGGGVDILSGFFFELDSAFATSDLSSFYVPEFGSAALNPIPEPGSLILLALGIGALAWSARR